MAAIFISYRRDDAGGHAGRLCDRLTARFGDDRVFMDLQDIGPGQNFERSIDETIAGCDSVLAVIGPRWLDSIHGRDGREDFVRRELAAALSRNVLLIPVLVGNARMPGSDVLPPDLSPLAQRNAIEVRDEHFEDDVGRLAAFLDGRLVNTADHAHRATARRRPAMLGAAALIIAALAVTAVAAVLLWPRRDAAVVTVPAAAPVLDGGWIAEMQKPGQQQYRVRLEFVGGPGGYLGTVRYPTGDGTIEDVVVDGRKFSFKTVHVPQFDSAAATVAYQGELVGDEMRLTGSDSAGIATGIARRLPR
jgi:hypothetical protein